MIYEEFDDLQELFFMGPELESRHAWWHWVYFLMMPVLDITGPLSHIFSTGQCDYTYKDDERFPGVRNPITFYAWAKSYHLEYDRMVATFLPRTPAQRRDLAAMREYSDIIAKALREARDILNESDSSDE
ncbi:MAG: hypothetical protein ACRBF0_18860 [Calditrichia bacterium]